MTLIGRWRPPVYGKTGMVSHHNLAVRAAYDAEDIVLLVHAATRTALLAWR